MITKPELTAEEGVRLLQILHWGPPVEVDVTEFFELKAALAKALGVPICFGLDDCSTQALLACTQKFDCSDLAAGKPIKFVEV